MAKALTARMTVKVNPDIYDSVIDRMHYGQFSLLQRKILKSIAEIIDTHGTKALYQFMYDKDDLTLINKGE